MEALMKITRDVFCCDTFFQKFAYYLTSVYRTKTKGLLMKGSVLSYIGCILIIGQTQLFKGADQLCAAVRFEC